MAFLLSMERALSRALTAMMLSGSTCSTIRRKIGMFPFSRIIASTSGES